MAEITAKLRQRALLVPQYATDEEMKKVTYNDMLKDDIMDFVSIYACKTLNDMIWSPRAGDQFGAPVEEGSNQVHAVEGPVKRPTNSDQRLKGHQGRRKCSMCGKMHIMGLLF